MLARTLGMDLMLVPKTLRPDLEDFVRSGGRFLGQPSGIGAPPSLVDQLIESDKPVKKPPSAKRKP